MAWPSRTYWTKEQARTMGQKGGKAPRKNGRKRTPDYLAGYLAGWAAGARERSQRRIATREA